MCQISLIKSELWIKIKNEIFCNKSIENNNNLNLIGVSLKKQIKNYPSDVLQIDKISFSKNFIVNLLLNANGIHGENIIYGNCIETIISNQNPVNNNGVNIMFLMDEMDDVIDSQVVKIVLNMNPHLYCIKDNNETAFKLLCIQMILTSNNNITHTKLLQILERKQHKLINKNKNKSIYTKYKLFQAINQQTLQESYLIYSITNYNEFKNELNELNQLYEPNENIICKLNKITYGEFKKSLIKYNLYGLNECIELVLAWFCLCIFEKDESLISTIRKSISKPIINLDTNNESDGLSRNINEKDILNIKNSEPKFIGFTQDNSGNAVGEFKFISKSNMQNKLDGYLSNIQKLIYIKKINQKINELYLLKFQQLCEINKETISNIKEVFQKIHQELDIFKNSLLNECGSNSNLKINSNNINSSLEIITKDLYQINKINKTNQSNIEFNSSYIKTISKNVDLNVIGGGNYSNIYSFKKGSLDICLKCINLINTKRFIKEIEIMFILEKNPHKNIIKYYDFWVEDRGTSSNIFIEMEYNQDYITLHQYLEKSNKPIQDETIITITNQITSALKHLHSFKIIHGDLKPKNILINKFNNDIKIIDFGLSFLNGKRNVIGSCDSLYSVPGCDDKSLDYIGLGIIVYEMMTFFEDEDERCKDIILLKNHLFEDNQFFDNITNFQTLIKTIFEIKKIIKREKDLKNNIMN